MRQFPLILRTVEYLERILPSKLEVGRVAAELSISKWHLQHEFKRHTGMSISQYYRLRLLSLAAHQVATGNERIIDVALEHGFESQEAFYRAFKRNMGVSPKQVKHREDFVHYLSFQPLKQTHLEFVAHMDVNPPAKKRFEGVTVYGTAQTFPSIVDSFEPFEARLDTMWRNLDQHLHHWKTPPTQFFTLEYRNRCSNYSGQFEMLAACNGKPEEPNIPLTEIELPTRDMWCFTIPSRDHIAAFFYYLHFIFTPKINS
ncbi:helix-turn-helix transcriptional regulator [Vibrio mexicanus]|uniref:helix-turn-helix transcriptional regulator n=1 Tax=Vibrio mexicanus TaxID=1004326 RepID=UPI00069BAACB|nr:AraC family transcriptional regulator [Vibrio mexicanus]